MPSRLLRQIIGSMLVMGVLGCVYGWSLFSPLLQAQHGLAPGQLQMIFGLKIALYSVLMIVTGRLYRLWGLHPLLWASVLCYGGGYILAGQVSHGDPLWLTLCISGLCAVGVACGYVTTMTNLMRAMAPRTGLAAGLSAAAFGGGGSILALVLGPLLDQQETPILALFTPVGLTFMAIMALGALLIPAAPPPVIPEPNPVYEDAPTPEGFWDPAFLRLLGGMLCGTLSGFLLLGHLKPLTLSLGATDAVATLAVGVFSLGNAGGRLMWGVLGDRLGAITLPLSQGLLALALLLFSQAAQWPVLLPLAAGLVALMFGAGFVLFANQLAIRYGVAAVSKRYPLLLLGQAVAALSAPFGGVWAEQSFHHPAGSVWLAAAVAGVGTLIVSPLVSTAPAAASDRLSS